MNNMNYKNAFEILQIDLSKFNSSDITIEYLKKQYRKLALINHPDKNGNSQESKEKFQQINEAYHFLKREIKILNADSFIFEQDNKDQEDDDDHVFQSSVYFDILKDFIKNVFDGKGNDIMAKIVIDIMEAGKKISVKIFDELDKDTALHIYTFLSNNRQTLHLNSEILVQIRDIVLKKYDSVQVYRLNPTLNDLINHNIYKLYINEELFLVPLWHIETYYESKEGEIIVLCDPELPPNLSLDDDNNIHIKVELTCEDFVHLIKDNRPIRVIVADKIWKIPLCQLYVKREQTYRIVNEGISKAKKDIYDVSEKTDIFVKIIIDGV